MEVRGRGVNEVFSEALQYLSHAGVEENSRNGSVIVAPEPVLTTYTHPTERVLFSPLRDANPFLHVFEALGFLAGHADLEWYAYFAKNIRNYSDDGKTLWGNYGVRWRSWFGWDQLRQIVKELKKNPASRRCVLSMWDPGCGVDLAAQAFFSSGPHRIGDFYNAQVGGLDVPCNTHIYFDLRGGVLNMTVMQRSGDALWGVYGANAVHMSILQEYVAAGVGAPVGVYRQFCNNFHVYPANLPNAPQAYASVAPFSCIRALAIDADTSDAYKTGEVTPFPLVNTDIETWDADLKRFMERPCDGPGAGSIYRFEDPFFNSVAQPMYCGWKQRKEKRGTCIEWARLISAPDWRKACVEWIERREAKKGSAE
jgi:thymidylate synthase